jgi:arylsulfatase
LSGVGRSGTGTLSVDEAVVSTQKMERTIPLVMLLDDAFAIGDAAGPPFADCDYEMPFPFTGKINGVTILIEKSILTEADKKKREAAQRASQD